MVIKHYSYLIHIILLSIFLSTKSHAQVGIGTTNVDPSSILHLRSDNKGFLVPKMALNDVDTEAPVTSPAEGLIIYNDGGTEDEGLYYWNGSKWINFTTNANDGLLENGISNRALVTDGAGNPNWGLVNGNHIQNNSITTDKITNSAVTSSKLANNAITQFKIDQSVVGPGLELVNGKLQGFQAIDSAVQTQINNTELAGNVTPEFLVLNDIFASYNLMIQGQGGGCGLIVFLEFRVTEGMFLGANYPTIDFISGSHNYPKLRPSGQNDTLVNPNENGIFFTVKRPIPANIAGNTPQQQFDLAREISQRLHIEVKLAGSCGTNNSEVYDFEIYVDHVDKKVKLQNINANNDLYFSFRSERIF